jgi:uncharacterized protein YqcC (DUF446 family)
MTDKIRALLLDIETELKNLELWSEERPTQEALASTQPFCIDTLSLPEWIQFILLERLHAMMNAEVPLPSQCGVTPIAEEYFKTVNTNEERLIALLLQLDQSLSSLH